MKFNIDWTALKKTLIEQLKGAAVKAALKKLLGSAVAGGPKAWIISFITKELYDEFAEPLIIYALGKVGYVYSKVEGRILIKRLEEARENNDADAYNDAADDVFDLRS